jgi:DNA modification methylase
MSRHRQTATPSNLQIEYLAIGAIKPDPANARRHTAKQISKLSAIIREFGFHSPIVIDETGLVLAGHARLEAAKSLGLASVPCVRLGDLTAIQKKAVALADNRIGDESTFDPDALRALLVELTDIDFDIELAGFDTGEVDLIIDGSNASSDDPADRFEEPAPDQAAISQPGDLWLLGAHRLLCGDALEAASYEAVLGDRKAQMVFSDPPWNLPVDGYLTGLGRHKHREFLCGAGEMSEAEFRAFLARAIALIVACCVDGAIAFVCIDWRHVGDLLAAANGSFTELKNICVWAKTSPGKGGFYRSQHELVAVFKKGKAPHRNNIHLGEHGRFRSNLWTYPGANSFGSTREAGLAVHPTVKPLALVADAIRDVSKNGDLVLDPFVGSGTTILAAERTRRRAAAIEIDPLYCDVAVHRWEAMTGIPAVLASDGRSFAQVAKARSVTVLPIPVDASEGQLDD